jgi:hypothetical protein
VEYGYLARFPTVGRDNGIAAAIDACKTLGLCHCMPNLILTRARKKTAGAQIIGT